jgi:hypothetical protein
MLSFCRHPNIELLLVLALPLTFLFTPSVNANNIYVQGGPALRSRALTADDESEMIIDIISVGSLIKPEFQDAQERTFGSLPVVRNFFRIDERTDSDTECPTTLSWDESFHVMNFCSKNSSPSPVAQEMREKIYGPNPLPGWMCAQKRPIEGLNKAIQHWEEQARLQGNSLKDQLPTYLLIIDDDTWVNVKALIKDMQQAYSPDIPHVVAGCQYEAALSYMRFTFPYGGFGSIFTTAALEKMLRPIDCSQQDHNLDEFTRLACWRLDQNIMGETDFFKDGMSIAQLAYEFGAQQPLTQLDQWNPNAGYCFHSDHALGYFVNYYHILAPKGTIEPATYYDTEHIVYEQLVGEKKQCENVKDKCNPEHRLCHYMNPNQMDFLHREMLLVEKDGHANQKENGSA